jgi:CheY-like chemotaxis protein
VSGPTLTPDPLPRRYHSLLVTNAGEKHRTDEAPIRVLHVDDDPNLAETTARLLEHENERFIVDTDTSACEVLATTAIEKFDCIVSDYDMPHMDGLQFLEAVRDDHPNMPFILFCRVLPPADGRYSYSHREIPSLSLGNGRRLAIWHRSDGLPGCVES